MRNYTYPRGSVQLVRGVTFDFDTEGVGGALGDAEYRADNAINEEDDKERLTGSNESKPEESPEINEEKRKASTAPDSILPPQRTESLVYLPQSRRGSLIAKYKSV